MFTHDDLVRIALYEVVSRRGDPLNKPTGYVKRVADRRREARKEDPGAEGTYSMRARIRKLREQPKPNIPGSNK